MNILTLENISKGFSEKNLFENLSMGIDDSDRIGLVGVNGIGKTTFLPCVCSISSDKLLQKNQSIKSLYVV